jgi:hypothetical protein
MPPIATGDSALIMTTIATQALAYHRIGRHQETATDYRNGPRSQCNLQNARLGSAAS